MSKAQDNKEKVIKIKPTKIEDKKGNVSYSYGIGGDQNVKKGFVPSVKYAINKFASMMKSMVVTVTGNEQYNGTTKWVVFKLEEVFAVYFTNPNNWSQVNAYVWDANENLILGAWPGTPVQKDPTTGYYIVTGVEPGQNIIFSNGNGSQTGDLAIPTNGDCKTDGKGWATLEGEIEDLTIRVYFTNPDNWSNVYAYSWGGTNLGNWPGTKLQKDATTG